MGTIEVTIERVPPDAWAAYRAIRLEALQDEPHAFGASYADAIAKPDAFWRSRLEQAQEQVDNWLLFARKGDQLVGMIGAFTQEDAHIAEIISVYVSPAARGHGVAQRLMAAILDELAGSAVVEKARLVVNIEQLPALSLYKRFGFEIVAQEAAVLGDGKLHTEYAMERLLSR